MKKNKRTPQNTNNSNNNSLTTHLVKAEFLSEWDTEFRHTRLHSVIGAVQSGIALNAPVLHLLQRLRQRQANGEPTAAVRHSVREVDVLQMALAQAPNVVILIVIVLVQNPNQIIRHENSVVVPHHEPPRVLCVP